MQTLTPILSIVAVSFALTALTMLVGVRLSGHAAAQRPHLTHSDASISQVLLARSTLIAPSGQVRAHCWSCFGLRRPVPISRDGITACRRISAECAASHCRTD